VKMGVEYNRSMGDELTAAMPPRHPPSKNRRPPSRVVDEDRNEEGTEQIERRESQKSNSVSSSGSHMSETHKKEMRWVGKQPQITDRAATKIV
jgi:hypothetical protein